MTRDEAQWLLDNITNPLVKCEPAGRGGWTTWGRAKLLSVSNDEYAMIQPFGHKKPERMELRYLHKWKSRMEPLTEPIASFVKVEEEKTMKPWKPGDRKYTEAQWVEARKLLGMGKTFVDTAKITGINKSALYSKLRYEFQKKKPDVVNEIKKALVPVEKAEIKPRPEWKPIDEPPYVSLKKVDKSHEAKIKDAIHSIIQLNIPDAQKLMAIEGLVS